MKLKRSNLSSLVLLILYAVGFVGTLLDVAWVQGATPIHLLVCLALFIANESSIWRGRILLTGIGVFLFGIAIEWLGVRYQWPFGAYVYGSRLGIKLDGIPLTMGINWLLLGLLSADISKKILADRPIIMQSSLGAVFMLLTDVPMERICGRLDFWHWQTGTAPIQNYIAWLVLGIGVQYFILKSRRKEAGNAISVLLFSLQFLFFLGLSFLLKD